MNFILTPQQQTAAEKLREFLSSDQQQFVLHGLAGTGKTTLLATVAHEFPSVELVAFTGKAASVLRQKCNLSARTLHSLFYRLMDKLRDEKTGRTQLRWARRNAPGSLSGKVVMLDECSMVNEFIARDLLQTGAKLISCGDPGQLPPVRGRQFFTRPDFVLTEVQRQALDSPIIRQAHAVRKAGRYHADEEDFRVVGRVSDSELLAADVVLCWTNQTRHAINRRLRTLNGCHLPHPMAGEPVLCLRNAPEFNIFNGGVYRLLEGFQPDATVMHIEVEGEHVAVDRAIFLGDKGSIDDYDDDEFTSAFDYGYALTVHKSQGSEWQNVVLFDECGRADIRRQWLYTAITRAAEKIVIQR